MLSKIKNVLRLDLPMLPVAISIFAILLSQIPPLYSMFTKPNIKVELGTNAQIFDNWGGMIFQPYMLLHNAGNESGLVKSVEILIVQEEQKAQVGVLPVQTFFDKVQFVAPNSRAPQLPVRLIRIEPGAVWSNYVSAWKLPNESRQDKISKLISDTEEHFDKNYKEGSTWTMPDDLLLEAESITNKEQDKILSGKYFVLVSAIDKEQRTLDTKVYTFTLRKSQIEPFNDKLKEYKYGGGIIFPLRKNKFFGTWVELHSFDDNKKIDSLIKKYLSDK